MTAESLRGERAELERETELRRAAEKHNAELKEALAAAPYPSDLEQIAWECNGLRERVRLLEEELREAQAERDSAVETAMAKDFRDVMESVDVNARFISRQAAKVRTEADRIRKWANTENARITGLHTVADRLDTLSSNISRFLDRPALTQFRQEQAAREHRRHQQKALQDRAEKAEAALARVTASSESLDTELAR